MKYIFLIIMSVAAMFSFANTGEVKTQFIVITWGALLAVLILRKE